MIQKPKKKNRPGRPGCVLPTSEDGKLTMAGKLAVKIRKGRLKCKLTAEECAKKSGMSISRWYDHEGGKIENVPTTKRLSAIEETLGLKKRSLVRIVYPGLR